MCQKKIFEYAFLSIIGFLLSIIVISPVYATVIPSATVLSAGSGVWVERAGERIALQQKDPVFKGDVIITNGVGRAQIIFADNTIAAIGPNTQILVSEFSFSAVLSSKFKAEVSRGVVRFITGKIVERNRAGFSVDTPQAIIGIRGTTFSVAVSDDGVTVVSAIDVRRDFPIDVRNVATEAFSLIDTSGGVVDVSSAGNTAYMGRGLVAGASRIVSRMIAAVTPSIADGRNDSTAHSAGIFATKGDPEGELSFDLPVSEETGWVSGTLMSVKRKTIDQSDIRDFAVDRTNMTGLGNIWMMKVQGSVNSQ